MKRISRIFPPAHSATEEGVVAVSEDFSASLLIDSYLHGIFPWPMPSEKLIPWFSPDPRGILDLNEFRVSKSLKKLINKKKFTTKINEDFELIMKNCAKVPRKEGPGTWITPAMSKAYLDLFEKGYAYCVGTYLDEKLVGGLYGVCVGEIISGESMFHHADNASKVALFDLAQKLKSSGIRWVDTQMVTPILESFGAKEISRDHFLKIIDELDPNISRDQIFKD